MKYYDSLRNCLAFFDKKATPDFWDEHWDVSEFRNKIIAGKNDRFIIRTTSKYLAKGKILEGGCGMGGKVFALHCHGYDVFGIDYAVKTIQKINSAFPDLKVFPADVMKLPFTSSTFDGYWSLGVIEHFFQGYDAIADEIARVLKVGGFLFLTFPSMSLMRRVKALAGLYPRLKESIDFESFYQFALDEKEVTLEFQKRGFQLLEIRSCDGLKGLKEEISFLQAHVKKLYNYSGKNTIIKIARILLSKLFEPIAGHISLLVFKKV